MANRQSASDVLGTSRSTPTVSEAGQDPHECRAQDRISFIYTRGRRANLRREGVVLTKEIKCEGTLLEVEEWNTAEDKAQYRKYWTNCIIGLCFLNSPEAHEANRLDRSSSASRAEVVENETFHSPQQRKQTNALCLEPYKPPRSASPVATSRSGAGPSRWNARGTTSRISDPPSLVIKLAPLNFSDGEPIHFLTGPEMIPNRIF